MKVLFLTILLLMSGCACEHTLYHPEGPWGEGVVSSWGEWKDAKSTIVVYCNQCGKQVGSCDFKGEHFLLIYRPRSPDFSVPSEHH